MPCTAKAVPETTGGNEGQALSPGRPGFSLPLLDLSPCTLLPGLVDSHVHLFLSGSSDPDIRKTQQEASWEHACRVISAHVARHRAHGVLAVRDGGDRHGHTLRYKVEARAAAEFPLLRSPGTAWHAPGRYGALIGRTPPEGTALARAISLFLQAGHEGPAGHVVPGNRPAPAHSRAGAAAGARRPPNSIDHLKIVNSGLNSLTRFGVQTPPQFSLDQLRAAVETGKKQGLKTMVHANGETPVRMAIQAGCDSVEHGFFMGRDNLERLVEKQIVWVPTACTMKAYAEGPAGKDRDTDMARRNLDHQLEQLRLARELGVPVAAGTDSGNLGVHHGASLREEIGLLVLAGFSLEAAIRAATWNGARLLGLEERLGLLRPGKPATFIAVEADPAELPAALARVAAVFVRGQRIAFR